jgi:hypothetical protein
VKAQFNDQKLRVLDLMRPQFLSNFNLRMTNPAVTITAGFLTCVNTADKVSKKTEWLQRAASQK